MYSAPHGVRQTVRLVCTFTSYTMRRAIYKAPQSTIFTSDFGLSRMSTGADSIFWISSKFFVTLPNTQCFPSSQGHGTVVMKNCEPLVFGPAFAMDSSPGAVWRILKFSSANLLP
ncbi:hypothetical protein FVE85_7981 [Porphyridium purpureum]|uniref:Uncharacterized protein n=1 Tax=Porphyridium purpureum TaxID=35688 RepID=A0A5J4YP65_PORPP|nr:hypothetical protein FVE85_7981 [Porphyridium purpureum]|eukprot:POR9807..scf295_9